MERPYSRRVLEIACVYGGQTSSGSATRPTIGRMSKEVLMMAQASHVFPMHPANSVLTQISAGDREQDERRSTV